MIGAVSLVAAASRLAQFASAVVLFGSPLFVLYGLRSRGPARTVGGGWPRLGLAGLCLLFLLAASVSLAAQTAAMTGAAADAFDPGSLWAVLSDTHYGHATAVRLGAVGVALLACLCARVERPPWGLLASMGLIALVSFAWSGHGAADEGWNGLIHLTADVVHLIAAGVWLGALAVLMGLLVASRRDGGTASHDALLRALEGFSGIGSGVVAVLVLSGLVNSWYLVGPDNVWSALTSLYGILLAVKLVVFAGMLGLAALNRFALTPGLADGLATGSINSPLRALHRSVAVETLAGVGVLALVALMGTLPPPSAMGMG